MLEAHLGPVQHQFLGHDLGQAAADALAHLGLAGDQRDDVGIVDADIGTDARCRRGRRARGEPDGHRHQKRRRGTRKELAAINDHAAFYICHGIHDGISRCHWFGGPAAQATPGRLRMAAFTRWKVPHWQMFEIPEAVEERDSPALRRP